MLPTDKTPSRTIAIEAGMVFVVVALLYVPLLSRQFDLNGIAEAAALDEGNMFTANHLLYRPLGLLASFLISHLGIHVRSVTVLKMMSALSGAATVSLTYLFIRKIVRQVVVSRFIPAIACLWLATSWSQWVFSTDAMYIPLASMFVAAAMVLFLGDRRTHAMGAGLLLALGVATWQAGVLLIPVFLLGYLFLKSGPIKSRVALGIEFALSAALPIAILYLVAAWGYGIRTFEGLVRWGTSHGNEAGLPMWGHLAADRFGITAQSAFNSMVFLNQNGFVQKITVLIVFVAMLVVGLRRLDSGTRMTWWLACGYLVFVPFILWWDPWEAKWFVVPNVFFAGLLAQTLARLNPGRYAKPVVAMVLMVPGIVNLKCTVWERRFGINENLDMAACVASHMHEGDAAISTDWSWGGYLGYFFARKEVSLIDWAAALGDPVITQDTIRQEVMKRQQAQHNIYVRDFSSYKQDHLDWLQSQTRIPLKNLAEYQGEIAFDCSGTAFRRVPHLEPPKPVFTQSDRFRLSLSTALVHVGEKYKLSVLGAPGKTVAIRYIVNDDPEDQFTTTLDSEGSVVFPIAESTKKGTYRLTSFRIEGHKEWILSDATLVVQK